MKIKGSLADCIPLLGEDVKDENFSRWIKIGKKWFGDKNVQSSTGGKHEAFDAFVRRHLPNIDTELNRIPNAKELTTLELALKSELSHMGTLPGTLGKLFKLPANILSKTPTGREFWGEVVRSGDYRRGNLQNVEADLNIIRKNLNIAAKEVSILNKWGRGRSNAQKRIQDMQATYKRILAQDGELAAKSYWESNLSDKALLSKDSQLKAMQRLWELITNPELVAKQDPRKLKLDYGPELVEAANIWHFGTKKTAPLKERLWDILRNGLKDTISMLEGQATQFNGLNSRVGKLNELYLDYFATAKELAKYNKDNNTNRKSLKPQDYFPRQVLDIAPTFAKLSDDMHSGYADANSKVVGKYLDRMMESVRENLKVPGNTFERNINPNTRPSKDVLDILDTYAHNVIQFNFNARVSKATIKALKSLSGLKEVDQQQTVKFLADYIQDTHDAALGLNYRNSKLNNIAKAITSWEFISKLGFNLRTVAKNSTQSLQNWVYMGSEAIYTGLKDLNTPTYKTIVAKEMDRHGFEFVNIQEFALPKDLMSNLKIDQSGKVVEVKPNVVNKFNDWLENIARISGKPMQWVENHVNRGLTFKLAFMQKYNQLTRHDKDLRQYIEKNPGADYKKLATDMGTQAEKVIKRASNYASETVRELHFLYDPFAKPHILTKNPVGSVLGQFTTYSINFFEYQRKLAAKGGKSVLAGEWNSPEAFRLYRLGMLYTMVTGLGAVTNTAFSNLVQNDTWDRLQRLDQWIGGTKEEKEQAFFGLDPITSTFGGPFVSDVIKLGSLANFMNMGPEEYNNYTDYYQGAAEKTKDSRVEEFVRTLNTQAGRFLFTTGPRMINGTGLPTIIGQELGLYTTPELDELRDKIFFVPRNYLPKPVGDWFTPDEKKSQGKIDTNLGVSKSGIPYSDQDKENILKSLQMINDY